MTRKLIYSLFFVLVLVTTLQAGGGWPQPKNGGYFKLSQSMIRAPRYFSPGGDLLDITTTSVYSTAFYGEYGLTDRLTVLTYAPLFVRGTINNRKSTINGAIEPGDEFNGVGDIEIGLKYGVLTKGPIALSAGVMFHLPTGENVGGASELLQSGDGAFSQLFRIEASHSFYPAPIYATLFAGYNNRGTATYEYSLGKDEVTYSDEFRWGGELGWTPGENKWLVALKWQQVISMQNGSSGGETGSSSLFGNNVEYFSITPEVSYTFKNRLGISAAVGTAMSGKNILGAPNYIVGVHFVL